MKHISTIHLKIILRNDVPQFVIDFFTSGNHHEDLPSVLYKYGFRFDNLPNFATGTYLFFGEVQNKYYLQIEHQFDFDNEAEVAQGYWFVGGLAQYAQDNLMAGYIKHSHVSTQLFGFKNKQCYWLNGADINFEEQNTEQE
jgi:hypothetical protein